jgi:spermidine synthase
MSAQARSRSTQGLEADPAISCGPGGWPLAGAGACFVLSGFAALVYQTAWLRQFSLVFGTAELAVATVLAAYMAGLATGAALINRWLPRIRRPLRAYAALELGICISAVAVPALLAALGWILTTALGHQPAPPASRGFGGSLFYMTSAFIALGLPTALMGATLPLLARYAVRSDREVARRIGFLYAGNTLGAVGGALATGFVLLPGLGLTRTVATAALVNLVAFIIAARIARRTESTLQLPADRTAASGKVAATRHERRLRFTHGPQWILPIMLLSGGVSFVYEVLWTRMLSHTLGSSMHAFATMLASVLAGIALGGALAAAIVRHRTRAAHAFVVAQLLTAAASAFAYLHLDAWVPAFGGVARNPWLAMLLMLPATLAIGATYPLAVRVLASDAITPESAAARVYAWNTVGAVFGALLAGLAILPVLRFEGTAHIAAASNLALAFLALVLLTRARLPWLITVFVIAAGGAVLFQPPMPAHLLLASPLRLGPPGVIRFYDVGRSASVVVLERDGMLALRTNGLPEALVEMAGTPPKFSGEFWLSPLATIANPRATSILVIGLGGGGVIDGAAPGIRSIDVIELEPKVLAADRAIGALRKRDPLGDPRLNIILNDARGALALTDKRYDAIVSQPSHPWTAGASHLYTREFMQLARAHLTAQGVFIQWMNIAYLDEALLRSFAATLLDVFPELEIYRPDPNTLVFVAALTPLDTVARLARNSAPITSVPQHYGRFGILAAEDVAAALVADHVSVRALAGGAEIITDDRNRLATSSVYELGRGLSAASAGRLLAPYDPLRSASGWLSTDAARSFSVPYIARRLALYAQLDPTLIERVSALAARVADQPTALYVRAIAQMAKGDSPGAVHLLTEAAALAPDNRQILFERLRPYLAALARGTAEAQAVRLAAKLTGSAAAVNDALRYGAAEDWPHVAELDAKLALANPTDAWFFEAITARAEWRSRVSDAELRQQFGGQCMGLVDQAIVSQPAVALFELRARCAASAGQANALIESIYAFATGTRANLDYLSQEQLAAIAPHLDALARIAAGAGESLQVDARRAQEVLALLAAVSEQVRARGQIPL